MKQTSFIDAPTKAPWSCPMCGGTKKKSGRCKPCYIEPPKPCGRAWSVWTRGVRHVVEKRLASAGLGRLLSETWPAIVLEDRPVPAEAAALLVDVLALPISAKKYQRTLDRALLASQLLYIAAECGVRREADDERDPQRDIASLAATRIFAEQDARGLEDLGGRRVAEILWRCIYEHRARRRLAKQGLKGAALERAVVVAADRDEAESLAAMAHTHRVDLGLRVEAPVARVDDGAAEEEAAEIESAEAAQKGATS